MQLLFHQYDLIRNTREILFQYCDTIAPYHFIQDHENFGGRSMRYLLVHVANVYRFWLGHFPQLNDTPFAKSDSINTVKEVRPLYNDIDSLVNNFLKSSLEMSDRTFTNKVSNREQQFTFSALQLFTHVITHEFHHKGQLLSMSRQLGYTPVDTDIIRFA